jgi:Flp pilus assembly protein TadG
VTPTPRRGKRNAWLDRTGAAAVEFALIVPLFGLLLAGVVDLGNLLYVRFRLDSAVSAAANYAVVNASSVSSTGAATLAATAATIVQTSQGANWANATIVINDGPSATILNGTTTTNGTAASADLCYCPSGWGTSTTWGSGVACGTSCAAGGTAGKFVTIIASRNYTPLFTSYGFVKNGLVSASATVQVQ